MDIQEIELNAKTLYGKGMEGRKQLMETWEKLTEAEKLLYPEVAFQTAKLYITSGDHASARQNLAYCFKAWDGVDEQLARVWLLHAQLNSGENDFEAARNCLAEVQRHTQNPLLLAEAEFLLGEIIKTQNPTEALDHFMNAKRYFMREVANNPVVEQDVARVCLRAAQVAFQQNMRMVGWHHQNYAETVARKISSNTLLTSVLLQKGEAWEREGDYLQASEAYAEASRIETFATQQAQVQYRRARIALLTHDFETARRYLELPFETDHMHTLCSHLLVHAWLLTLYYDFAGALNKVEEARYLVGDDAYFKHQIKLTVGFIGAQAGDATADHIEGMVEAIEFFANRRLTVELSQALLILAWLYASLNDVAQVQQCMTRLQGELKGSGHVAHLTTLYETSLPLLGGYWEPTLRDKLEATIKKYRKGIGSSIRVFAMGVPHIYIGNSELPMRSQYGRINVKLLLYMLEKRRARLWELTEALWQDGDPAVTQKRFHAVMSQFKVSLGVPDWCVYNPETQLYNITPGWLNYYDGEDFKRTYDLSKKAPNPLQALALSFKLLRLYRPFAQGLESEAFEELRHYYSAKYEDTVYRTEEMLPGLLDQYDLPPAWKQELNQNLKEAMFNI